MSQFQVGHGAPRSAATENTEMKNIEYTHIGQSMVLFLNRWEDGKGGRAVWLEKICFVLASELESLDLQNNSMGMLCNETSG